MLKYTSEHDSTPEKKLTSRHLQLIDIAEDVFQRKGYDAASIQEIADQLGILKGSIYHYVKSKDDLLFAVINRVHEAALKNVQDFPHPDLDALEDIRLFVRRHVIHSIEYIVGATVYFRDFGSLTRDRRAIVRAERERYTNVLVQLIQRAVAEGSGRADMSTDTITLAILGMTNWVYQWYRPNGKQNMDEIAENFAQLAVEMVAGPGLSSEVAGK